MFFVALDSGKYRYYEKYYDTNQEKWRQVSCTLKSKTRQAQAEARRILEDLIAKKLEVTSKKVKFSEVVESWLVLRERSVKESTYFVQKSIVSVFERQFGQKNVDEITSIDIQGYLMNPEWKVTYIRSMASVLNLVFSYARSMQLITENPVVNVQLPKQTKTIEEKRKQSMKFYSKEEMKEFLEYLNTKSNNVMNPILAEFLYLTGLRFGEATGLQKEDIDLDNMCLHVNHTLTRTNETKIFKLSSPKTIYAYRTVYFNDRCKELLEKAIAFNKSKEYQSYVFVNSRQRLFDISTFNAYIARYAEKLGLKPELKPTSHVFRHSHISLLVEMRLPTKVIMERVGHADEKMTTQIYTHITSQMQNDYVDKIRAFDLSKS